MTWVTFVPCFPWIFLGAPYVEALRANRRLSGALSTITAAVVGVGLNFAVWFALHVLHQPIGARHAGKTPQVSEVSEVSDPALCLTTSRACALPPITNKIPMGKGCNGKPLTSLTSPNHPSV